MIPTFLTYQCLQDLDGALWPVGDSMDSEALLGSVRFIFQGSKKGSGETEFRSAFSHVSRMPETATINYLWIFGDTSGILKKTESQNDKFLRDKRFTRYFTIHLCSA